MTIWFYSYACQARSGTVIDNGVTRKHPLLMQAEWRRDERIKDDPTIISYQRLDQHDWYGGDLEAQGGDPIAVQKVVDHALDDNQGEIW